MQNRMLLELSLTLDLTFQNIVQSEAVIIIPPTGVTDFVEVIIIIGAIILIIILIFIIRKVKVKKKNK